MKIACLPMLLCLATAFRLHAAKMIKIACIGNSITYGANIEDREHNCYPARLQQMLGNTYSVANYGVSGTTILRKGDHPYWSTSQYQQALAAKPDVVIIDFSANDSKLLNRVHLDEFEHDYTDLIRNFRSLPSHPRILLLLAIPSFLTDTTSIWDPVIIGRINPLIQKIAYEEGVEVIDMHSPFMGKQTLLPDGVHPDREGAGIMAANVYRVLAQQRDRGFNPLAGLKNLPLKKSSFYGYECADFTYDNRACKIVRPKLAAKAHPWIWRARFWGHEPQTDIALLQQGFTVVYCDVAELFGNSEAIRYWNDFYELMQKAGLAKKAVLEGMSRGGMYVFNWAAVNPGKVACVYVDNPVLKLQSWLLNVDPADPTVGAFKADYHLATREAMAGFTGNPIDKIPQIVKGRYPILILCADADEVVPPQENTLPFEQKVRESGGNITVMHKPGFKHHPHSLPDPTPIVDFILGKTG